MTNFTIDEECNIEYYKQTTLVQGAHLRCSEALFLHKIAPLRTDGYVSCEQNV